jgi:hypothetical protein
LKSASLRGTRPTFCVPALTTELILERDVHLEPSPKECVVSNRLLRLAMIAAVLLPAAAMAEEGTTGHFAGFVLDSQGNAVRGAVVTLVGTYTAMPIYSVTDSFGRFDGSSLPPGTYRVQVESSGHPVEVADFRIDLGQRLRLTFTMKPNYPGVVPTGAGIVDDGC